MGYSADFVVSCGGKGRGWGGRGIICCLLEVIFLRLLSVYQEFVQIEFITSISGSLSTTNRRYSTRRFYGCSSVEASGMLFFSFHLLPRIFIFVVQSVRDLLIEEVGAITKLPNLKAFPITVQSLGKLRV